MEVRFTTPALTDLEELRSYLSTRSPSGLANVIRDIEATVKEIPGSINKGLRTPRDDVWEKISPKYQYRIPYYVRENIVYVLRVYHPRREPLNYEDIVNLT
ncbi:type II toxin-antitoxin system RelE/ParE family toxin [Leucothrix pacifica]|uniref:Type II toxin-antitoxin system RelE/ParE family toxin n=1 Tax=Leucothrix pacifica TaxID=1247513 RepID=A0A317CMB6_9GAMM|nr:type II toxin-antitoxin system RelE/ParE family toxin [Leucothrix pacifica]PWQ99666.1 hypothetical protein DKW60_05155 [Leucothrix pacifica]